MPTVDVGKLEMDVTEAGKRGLVTPPGSIVGPYGLGDGKRGGMKRDEGDDTETDVRTGTGIGTGSQVLTEFTGGGGGGGSTGVGNGRNATGEDPYGVSSTGGDRGMWRLARFWGALLSWVETCRFCFCAESLTINGGGTIPLPSGGKTCLSWRPRMAAWASSAV